MALLSKERGPKGFGAVVEDEQAAGNGDAKTGRLTVTAEQVGAEVMKNIDANQQQAVKQAVNAGMKILFSEETHNQIFDSIRPEDEVPLADELGTGATNLMLMMYEHSKNTMPAEVIVPVGSILLAKACEFISESNMAPVTDEDYSEALEIFAVNIQDKLDPQFRQRNGLEQGQDQVTQPEPMMAQEPKPHSGLLNTGGMA